MSKSEIQTLRRTITKLTGREPKSDDASYLRDRLAELQERVDAGEDVRRSDGQHSVLSASMPVEARKAVDRMATRSKLGTSALIRAALALWAKANGFEKEATAITG